MQGSAITYAIQGLLCWTQDRWLSGITARNRRKFLIPRPEQGQQAMTLIVRNANEFLNFG
jgi:hypothetical protein